MGRGAKLNALRLALTRSSSPTQDVQPIPDPDKTMIRSQLVSAMIVLSNPADKTIRAQVAESVSLVAELDFPLKWPDLITVRSFTLCFKSAFSFNRIATGIITLSDRL
jgi:hypothetical protein